ncbi:hypothetical protein PPSIR1_01432 [Plesiocystis pacifica SIR-1]|uniref:Thioredoxin domain-containing protein n=2 Tax=Plesiocystis pacifica TaxID=191768 RepID=A6G8D7_9BACT|nr:hypothetical protein PPSIR1_01432 [Plesiocystis pacifica SIR-1]
MGPADPMWSLRAWSMPQALKLRPEPEYRDQALRQHPDDELVAGLLYNQLEAALREPGPAAVAQIRAAYEALQDERFAGTVGQFIARQHDPDRSTAPGQPLPAFSFSRLRGGDPITPESLRGRAYVLDFWSTSCKPCIGEMPRLHRAYAALNGVALPPERAKQPASYRDLALDTPRVEFVSIALDDDPDEVRRLQAEGWPMPWPNTVPADDDANADLWQRFNLVGVPTMIVVDADGTILASGTHVRADDLAALLPPGP